MSRNIHDPQTALIDVLLAEMTVLQDKLQLQRGSISAEKEQKLKQQLADVTRKLEAAIDQQTYDDTF